MQAVDWITSFMQNTSLRVRTYFTNCFAENAIIFTEEELSEYIALTHLTKEQILRAYKHFCDMQPQFFNGDKNPFLPRSKVMTMPEFKVNPFKERMLTVFSSYEEFMTFEDYLDMMSVLSENAPLILKAEYAFRIYDFDGDDMLSIEDLINLVHHLKADREMEDKDMRDAAIKVLIDGDVDEDGFLAFVEFHHLMARIEDFMSTVTAVWSPDDTLAQYVCLFLAAMDPDAIFMDDNIRVHRARIVGQYLQKHCFVSNDHQDHPT